MTKPVSDEAKLWYIDVYKYSFCMHFEADTPELFKRLVGVNDVRYEQEFTQDKFQRFRDEMSAVGIDLREILISAESLEEG
jgi:hypothetical protein